MLRLQKLRLRLSPIEPKKILSIIVLTSTTMIYGTSFAEEFAIHRDSEGKVEVIAYEQRLVFRDKDTKHVHIGLGAQGQACFGRLANWNLQRAIENAEIADCLTQVMAASETPQSKGGLVLTIGLKIEDGVLYPGHISEPAARISSSSLGDVGHLQLRLGTASARGCPRTDDQRGWVPTSLGYERLVLDEQTPTTAYRLPAHRRVNGDSRPLCIICDASRCGIELTAPKESSMSATLTWTNPASPSSKPPVQNPSAAWVDYDVTLREIMMGILPDRPHDYLQ